MSDKLILIEKDGVQISVHPGTLENHKLLGWTVVEPVVEDIPEAAAPAAKAPAPAKKGKGK